MGRSRRATLPSDCGVQAGWCDTRGGDRRGGPLPRWGLGLDPEVGEEPLKGLQSGWLCPLKTVPGAVPKEWWELGEVLA